LDRRRAVADAADNEIGGDGVSLTGADRIAAGIEPGALDDDALDAAIASIAMGAAKKSKSIVSGLASAARGAAKSRRCATDLRWHGSSAAS
ncbi:hypothetical protein ABTE34_20195, partial [Acinetobacter baumannii]